MQTRSQTRYIQSTLYKVDIDFDFASACWRENKKSIGNGSYKYICNSITKSGAKCGKKCMLNENYCSIHYKKSHTK